MPQLEQTLTAFAFIGKGGNNEVWGEEISPHTPFIPKTSCLARFHWRKGTMTFANVETNSTIVDSYAFSI